MWTHSKMVRLIDSLKAGSAVIDVVFRPGKSRQLLRRF